MQIQNSTRKLLYGLWIAAIMLCSGCSTKEERAAKRQAAIEAKAQAEQEAQAKKVAEEAEKERIAAEQAAERKRQEKERAARRKVYEAQWQQDEEARAVDRNRQKEHWESEKERLGETPFTLIGKHERSGNSYAHGFLQFDTDGNTNTTEQVLKMTLNCPTVSARFWDAQVGEAKTRRQWENTLLNVCCRGQHPHDKEWISVR